MTGRSKTVHHRRGTRLSKRLGTFAVVLVALCAGLVGVAQPASASVGCVNVYLINGYTGLAVSAELGDPTYPGMLRARSSGVGAWEKFQQCIDSANNVFTLKSLANNRYVTTEMNYPGSFKYMLRARATTAGAWEKFTLYGTSSPWMDTFKGYPNLYVSTEMNFSGNYRYMLRARSASPGEWETYRFGPA
ncbi:hypothetical protein AB0J74_19015 [Asanoa sp. NPDC049573]|uniref:fascin domain-containing protein n=1 Tax=Asanoa sp. NPDC049573 TaxID=3155396 RepID=UPI00343AA9F0